MQKSKEGNDAGKQLMNSLSAQPSVSEESIESNIAILVSELQPSPSPRSPRSSRSPHSGSSSPSSSGRQHQKYTLEDMEKMRKEIRQLQEKRAETMMNEMVELQRERNTALGKVKILTQTMEGEYNINSYLYSIQPLWGSPHFTHSGGFAHRHLRGPD